MRSPSPALASGPLALALLAICLPSLLAFNQSPSATFFNQALSLLGWGIWCAVLGNELLDRRARSAAASAGSVGAWAMAGGGLVLIACAVWSAQWGSLPWNLALSALGLLLAALLVFMIGWLAAAHGDGPRTFEAACDAFERWIGEG